MRSVKTLKKGDSYDSQNEKNQQTVRLNEKDIPCRYCGIDLTALGNFKFITEHFQGERYKEECCVCNCCGRPFIFRYDFFDPDGHIQKFVFSQDSNDPDYNWQDLFTSTQLIAIEDHLKSCKFCTDRLNEEMLSDAWFNDTLKKTRALRHA